MLILMLAATLAAADDLWPVPKAEAEQKNPVEATSKVLKRARSTYTDNCAFCHGDKGNGKGDGADRLAVPPADFTNGLAMLQATDGELFFRLSTGRSPMPPFRSKFSEEQRWGLVHLIRSFAKKPPGKPRK